MKQRYTLAKAWIGQMGAYLRQAVRHPFDFSAKTSHQDIVTAYDKEVERFFRSQIHTHFPEDDIVGEEYSGKIGETRGIRWYIDPIDGTTNFVNLRRNFAISVGCYRDGEPQFGLVLDVIQEDLYAAFRGEGAYKNETRLTNDRAPGDLGLMILSTPNVMDTFWREYPWQTSLRELADAVRAVRSVGSVALELCLVAEGAVDIFVAMRSAPWDHNGARLILQEAGCRLSQLGETSLCLDREVAVYACRSAETEALLRSNYHF